ncbi:hypothetical protein BKA70DRAFT_1418375 [Coprinopsis sp. MPI-PUGE-AT-0042]|nr:hypothetical protein BKA70DRAFT_1418375 [Coprinopsis sp. MPI-PUGE-AT-0042]
MSSKEDLLCYLSQLDPSLPFKRPEPILWDLVNNDSQIHHCLELVLSSSSWADALGDWLQRTFPSPLPVPATGCVHMTVLSSLASYIFFSNAQSVNSVDQASLQQDMNFALHAPGAIEKLSVMKFQSEMEDNAEEDDTKAKTSPRKKLSQFERRKQLQAEARKKKQTKPEEEAEIFRALGGLSVPKTSQEAQALISQLSLELKVMLAKYLAIVRTEKVSDVLLSSFVSKLTEALPRPVKERTRLDPIVTSVHPRDIISPVALSAFETPLKAALYFDSAADFGDWEVFVSNKAIGDLRSAQRRDRSFYDIVMKKIKELSHSHFSDDNQKALIGGSNAVPVFEAKMTGDSRLVYQIDCLPDFSGERERQVIRIFGVYTHTQVNRVWKTLGYQLARQGGREHRARCCQRVYNRERTLIVPAVFPPNKLAGKDPLPIPELPKEDLEEIHSILVLDKFVNFSKELRNSLIAELDVQHVFNLSSLEMEIIEHSGSCYVLGRSGTGKTTTMLFKMLGLERTFRSMDDSKDAKPRQLFVTHSPVLATRVEDYFARLLASLELGQKSEAELRDIAKRAPRGAFDAPKSMVHKKDMRWKAGLPARFSLLQEEHFPLFLTFDRLAEMIIGDVLAPGDSWLSSIVDALDATDKDKFQSMVRVLSSSKDILRYPTFLADYWDHFPQDLTRGLDPALVFSEIIGVIKGAEQSLLCKGRYLDKTTYLSLSDRTNYLFAPQRERIYELFVKYARLKRELGGFDAADRTHAILEVFNLVGVPGIRVEFLYVDEAQDNMLIDAMLLRSICKNPLGLFWAGDTAQTISIGNSFRFQDLKAFLHRLEQRRAQQLLDTACSSAQQPASFALAVNYRSHGGIIAGAHSVVEMLTRFWPTSIDKMAPERGIVDGIKPLFLGKGNIGGLRFHDLMAGGRPDHIEFGAAQCILVRDEAARDKLVQEVGEIGIIMTLYDSKGLEFDDVLLYQFFEDSTFDFSRWRVLLNLLPEQLAPKFDEVRHAGLCSKLKFLYVAVTRARKKTLGLRQLEQGTSAAVWASLGLVECFDSKSQQLPRFASTSSRQEWQETAETLFDNENYRQAVLAFTNARLLRQARISEAYHRRKEAELTVTKPERKALFQDAANLFLQCAKDAPETSEQRAFHGIAGLCWRQAGEYAQAAAAYRAAEEFGDALQMYQKVAMFDEGVQMVEEHEIEDQNLVEDFKDGAKVFYFKDQELRQVLVQRNHQLYPNEPSNTPILPLFSKAKGLFSSSEEALTYLEDNTFLDEARVLLLKDMGKTMEAAQVHLDEGRLLEAIQTLTSEHVDASLVSRGHDLIVQGLWKTMPFGGIKTSHTPEAKEVLQLASNLSGPLGEKVAIFLAIDRSDWAEARALGHRFLFQENEHTSALLCLSYALHPSNLHSIRDWPNASIAEILSDFISFCSLLKYHADNLDLQNDELRRLFNFQATSVENTYVVPPGSWLHSVLTANNEGSQEDDILIPSLTLGQKLKDGLLAFMASVIDRGNHECRTALSFNPCIQFVIETHCDRRGSLRGCRSHHITLPELTHTWIATQVRIHFQQVILCQLMESIPRAIREPLYVDRKFWISRLYYTLNPPASVLGSWSSVNPLTIPEGKTALGILRSWCHDRLYGYTGKRQDLELSLIYQAADLCFHLDRANATGYVHASSLVKRLKYQPAFHRAGKVFTIPELLGSLDAYHPRFLKGGVLFVRHVLDTNLFIDFSILCAFMEFLTGAFILAHRKFQWHNITLPRTQHIHLLHRLRRGVSPEIDSLDEFLLDLWQRILTRLVTGENAGYLLLGTASMTLEQLRRPFVPRVCRTMALVGYNIPFLREVVMRKMKPLELSKKHPIYLSYAMARSWKDMEGALANPTTVSALDELVQLWSADVRLPMAATPGIIKRVVFDEVGKIYQLLTKTPPIVAMPKPPRLPRSKKLPKHNNGREEGQAKQSGGAPPEQHEEAEAMTTRTRTPNSDLSQRPDSTLDATTGLPTEEAIGPEKVAAAEDILRAYGALLERRRREDARTPREIACCTFFKACLKETSLIKSSPAVQSPAYQKLFLGIVPHLLVVIQWVQTYVSEEMPMAKRALKAAKGIDFEKGRQGIIRIKLISKTLDKLHKTLEPRSPFHAKSDAKELFKIVSEVEEIFGNLPKAQSGEVQFDMQMAKAPAKELHLPSFYWDEEKKRAAFLCLKLAKYTRITGVLASSIGPPSASLGVVPHLLAMLEWAGDHSKQRLEQANMAFEAVQGGSGLEEAVLVETQ